MRLIETAAELRGYCDAERAAGRSVGFVPTMGYLHEGHLSLMRTARRRAERLVVSIFVNPTQFAPGEDLERYPRDLEGDRAKCAAVGVDVLFLPAVDEIYPPGDQTSVMVADISQGLCGATRPTHFRGVCTVVAKLFNLVGPCVAVFGAKDYQQLMVVRRMVKDLHMPVQVVEGETQREADGLAMSSRNAYLSAAQRRAASALHRALRGARERVQGAGRVPVADLLREARALIDREKEIEIDYLEARDAESLAEIQEAEAGRAVILVAANVGKTRLIDNLRL